jgi:hypothetical protein
LSTEVKILNKILVVQIQLHVRKITHHDYVGAGGVAEVVDCLPSKCEATCYRQNKTQKTKHKTKKTMTKNMVMLVSFQGCKGGSAYENQ